MRQEKRAIISDAAWAWEGLRRNKNYRKAWARHLNARPQVCDARASLRYIRLDRAYLEAETYGLIAFADPELSASEVPVFWRPDLLPRTLPVSFCIKELDVENCFSLASLNCYPTVLDTVEGERHVRLGGHNFWIQLVSQDIVPLNDNASIEVKLSGSTGLLQRINSVEQLFSLHRSNDGQPAPLKRPPTAINCSTVFWLGMFMKAGWARKVR